jgi:hypothetical protein
VNQLDVARDVNDFRTDDACMAECRDVQGWKGSDAPDHPALDGSVGGYQLLDGKTGGCEAYDAVQVSADNRRIP